MDDRQRHITTNALQQLFWDARANEAAAWRLGIEAFRRGEITGDDLAYAANCSRTKAFKMIRELEAKAPRGQAPWERETETAWR